MNSCEGGFLPPSSCIHFRQTQFYHYLRPSGSNYIIKKEDKMNFNKMLICYFCLIYLGNISVIETSVLPANDWKIYAWQKRLEYYDMPFYHDIGNPFLRSFWTVTTCFNEFWLLQQGFENPTDLLMWFHMINTKDSLIKEKALE